jgi:hypothetical protein
VGSARPGRALIIGLLTLLAGCHAKENIRETRLYQKIYRRSHFNPPSPVPGKMAAAGKDTIIAECAHESYANASKGLIVGEAGLHEDVFALRDRDSLAADAYSLDEAQRLEAMLRTEVSAAGHPAEQAACITQFVERLETLTGNLVEADKLQKEMDISAFNDSKRQAERVLEEKQREIQQSNAPGPR